MTENDSYIDALKSSLKKKVALLSAIDLENRKQLEVLQDPMGTTEAFEETVANKENLIKQIEELDEGFEQVYARVQSVLKADGDKYRDDIVVMQEYIRKITDKSTLIQTQEIKNRDLVVAKASTIRGGAKSRRMGQMASGQYYQNMMGMNVIDSQYLDKKK